MPFRLGQCLTDSGRIRWQTWPNDSDGADGEGRMMVHQDLCHSKLMSVDILETSPHCQGPREQCHPSKCLGVGWRSDKPTSIHSSGWGTFTKLMSLKKMFKNISKILTIRYLDGALWAPLTPESMVRLAANLDKVFLSWIQAENLKLSLLPSEMSLRRDKEIRSHSDLGYEETLDYGRSEARWLHLENTLFTPSCPLSPSLPPGKHRSHKNHKVFLSLHWDLSFRKTNILLPTPYLLNSILFCNP